MENTNLPEDNVRVIWEILPGDSGHILREITQDDVDPSLFSFGFQNDTVSFPLIPHPLLNPADDCLDRVWTQTVIKINYHPSEWLDEYEP